MVAGEPMDADGRVALEQIKGDIRRIFDIHERYKEDFADFKTRLNGHSTRLQNLESTARTAKAFWVTFSALAGAAATLIGVKGIHL